MEKSLVRKFAVNVLAIVFNRYAVFLIRGLVMFFVLAPYLQPRLYGVYCTVVAYAIMIGVLVDFGLNQALARELPRAGRDRAAMLGNALLIKALLAAAGVLVALVAGRFLSLEMRPLLLVASLAYFAFLSTLFETVYQVELTSKYAALIRIAEKGVSALLILLLVLCRGSLLAVIMVDVSASFLALFAFCFHSRRYLKPVFRLRRDLLRRLFVLGKDLVLVMLFFELMQRAGIFILYHIRGGDEVGWYGLARSVLEMAAQFPEAYMLSMFPIMSRLALKEHTLFKRNLRLSLKGVSFVAGIVCLLLFLLARPLFELVSGYGRSAGVMRILCWSVPFVFLSRVTYYALIAAAGGRRLISIHAATALAAFALAVPLIYYAGVIGAAVTVLCSEMIRALLLALAMRRYYPLGRYAWLLRQIVLLGFCAFLGGWLSAYSIIGGVVAACGIYVLVWWKTLAAGELSLLKSMLPTGR